MFDEIWSNQSGCHSPFPSRQSITLNQRLILSLCYAILTPLALSLNGFLIYGLFKTKQHSHMFARFILVLSVSDFCIGLFVQPVLIYLFISKEEGRTSCLVSWYLTFVAYVLLNFSGLVIFLVSVDRFLRLRKSLAYVHLMTIKRVNMLLLTALVFSIAIAVGCIVTSELGYFCYYNMVVISINGLAAGGILIFYLLAWRNVRHRISSLRSFQQSRSSLNNITSCLSEDSPVTTQVNDKLSKKKLLSKSKMSLAAKKSRPQYDAAMTRTVAAILLCCCLTYPPYFGVSFIRSLRLAIQGKCENKSSENTIWFFASFFLMFINSTANAILYSCHNRPLKELMKKLLTRVVKESNVVIELTSKSSSQAVCEANGTKQGDAV